MKPGILQERKEGSGSQLDILRRVRMDRNSISRASRRISGRDDGVLDLSVPTATAMELTAIVTSKPGEAEGTPVPVPDSSEATTTGERNGSQSQVPNNNSINNANQSGPRGTSRPPQSLEDKRILIRKQLVVLLHAIVCKRRDHMNAGATPTNCNVPFCNLMKGILTHLNSCKAGRTCTRIHCASSRQILIHWKYCVSPTCPVCVSLREVVPSSLLSVIPNPLCQAELMKRIARNQQLNMENGHGRADQTVPECEE